MNKQRLIVCLDGTWNNEDDSTNVLHHYNLVRTGQMEDGWFQTKFYQTGVGTGPLDSISGGAFGFGLEEHVREAYDWLVEKYNEGDEIYIFGFSRGAFTARSLVGFIGACGLLRRAAPLTVGQLWKDYAILGREREERQPASRRSPETIRQITDLVKDPWLAENDPIGKDGVRGQTTGDLNEAERLLIRWSRRVKITYLGVYDTVGAIGWDALAFPVLKSRMALHHNLRPTTLIQSCRHALAIQENRTSFNHTPFKAFVGLDSAEGEIYRATGNQPVADHWQACLDMWDEKIEQRWFTGAHSNVGGGYSNNRLASRPFEWMLEGAELRGLETEKVSEVSPLPPATLPAAKDSYAEFARPLWATILRAKRNYRLIDPQSEPQASAKPGRAGFTLQTIHETVDPTVPEYFTYTQRALPPNLYAYARRHPAQFPDALEPRHPWFGDGRLDSFALAAWASLAAVGLVAICKLIGLEVTNWVAGLACLAAFAAPIVDWGESLAKFKLALDRTSPGETVRRALARSKPRRQAFVDTVYWVRSFGVLLVFIGALHFIFFFVRLGWMNGANGALSSELTQWHWLMPVFAVAGMLLANGLDGASGGAAKARWKSMLPALGLALAAAPVAAVVLILLSSWLHGMLPNWLTGDAPSGAIDAASRRAALLLLLELGFFYFARAFYWVGEPMGNANLGSITPLQNRATPAGVEQCLDDWRQKLVSRWRAEDAVDGPAARRVRAVVREALWRDIFGFIPVYTLVLGFGTWFAARQIVPEIKVLQDLSAISMWWPVLPLAALLADYAEDTFHLRYLRRSERAAKPTFALLSFIMTWIKNVAFVGELLITLAAVVMGVYLVKHSGSAAGWRGAAALLVFGLGCVAIVLAAVKKAQTIRNQP